METTSSKDAPVTGVRTTQYPPDSADQYCRTRYILKDKGSTVVYSVSGRLLSVNDTNSFYYHKRHIDLFPQLIASSHLKVTSLGLAIRGIRVELHWITWISCGRMIPQPNRSNDETGGNGYKHWRNFDSGMIVRYTFLGRRVDDWWCRLVYISRVLLSRSASVIAKFKDAGGLESFRYSGGYQ